MADEAATEPEPGHSFIALIPHDGQEPPDGLTDRDALATWAAVTAPWHPALLARSAELPRIEMIDAPSSAQPGEVRIIPAGMVEALPSGYRTGAEDLGSIVLEGDADRLALAGRLLERVEPGSSLGEPDDSVALDFLALGTAKWMLRDLTAAMGHVDCLDITSLTREALAGARAWRSGDKPAATNRLRACFELLTQARERFYPVDAYVVDLCLLDPATPAEGVAGLFETRAPFTLLAPARAIEALAERDPGRLEVLRRAIDDGWADVVGGAYAEVDEPFLPPESILWQFRKGGEVYRRHIDDRNVETLARRRFGLYPQLPQIARRFGLRFALHLALDAGRFPIPAESKRLWESPDGSYLEALLRPPLAADRASEGLRLPWRLARTMKDDHVATLPLAHWPSPLAHWFVDLRRMTAYSPVLARWVTVGDYFHRTDRPFEVLRPEADRYVTPYLAQASARGDSAPISRRAEHARLRARVEGLRWLEAVEATLASPPASALRDEEDALELGRLDDARAALDRDEPARAGAVARAIVGGGDGGRPGYLVLNPLGVARRVTVLLPGAAPDLRPEGPLLSAQFTDEGVWAVVDLPAFGFAWVPRESSPDAALPAFGKVAADGRRLRNEAVEVEIDEATGGVRSFKAAGEPTARLGQQLVMTGLVGPDGQPASSRMRAEAFEVDYGGPALVQAVARGALVNPHDGRALARFEQRYRLWSGRAPLEIDIALSDLDADWLARGAGADPWGHFLSCRWAWPDPNVMMRRLALLSPEITEAERPETPDAIDISTRRQRTALLSGGLAHHRRHGARMLDTLLVAGRESARRFRVAAALDLEHPFHAALDLTGPAYVVPTDAGPPRSGPVGWLFRIDSRAVAVTRVEFVPGDADGRPWGLAFHLLETSGQAARCRLRLVRDPAFAQQTDLSGEPVIDLHIEGDAVPIDLTPHELARVEVALA